MLQSNFLKITAVFLVLYSILGGLFLPLSPNIEKASYTSFQDSLIQIEVYAPKVKEPSSFYLIQNALKAEDKRILKINNIKNIKDGFLLTTLNPNYYEGVNRGNTFDLWAQNKKNGGFVYFNVFMADSSRAQIQFPQIDKKELITKNPFSLSFPNRPILRESIRNLFFHVPMWFGMMFLLTTSLFYSVRYLGKGNLEDDIKAKNSVEIGLLFGTLGILTGMLWAKFTWGAFWTDDPKLNGAAIGMLTYCAYAILRSSVTDQIKKAKLAAVYNIFAYSIYIVFIYILPRLKASLHPGNGGNPGFNIYEQDNTMRLFFYPAVIGWILIGMWLMQLRSQIDLKISKKNLES